MEKNLNQNIAFTLVELIVVITILSILATIGFLSLLGYQKSARESIRLSDIKLIEKQLSLYEIKNSTLPIPDNYITITASGILLGLQGEVGTGVLLSMKQAGDIKDPLNNERYSIFVDSLKQNYQIVAMMENENSLRLGFVPESYALLDYSERYPRTFGSSLGVILGEDNTPFEKISGVSDTDIIHSGDEYTIIFSDASSITGSGNILLTQISLERYDLRGIDSSLLAYYPLDETIGGQIIDYSSYGNNGTYGGAITFHENGYAEDNTGPTSAYIDSGVGMNFSQNSYTMLAMVYISSARMSGNNAYFSNSPLSEELLLIGRSGSSFKYYDNGNSWIGGSALAHPYDTWIHVAFTVDTDGNTQMFHNGIGGSIVNIGSFPDSNIYFTAMNYNHRVDGYTTDKIDEIRLYDRKLSAEEVMLIYNKIGDNY